MNPLKREGATAKAMDGPVTRPSFMYVKNEGQVHLERQHRTMELKCAGKSQGKNMTHPIATVTRAAELKIMEEQRDGDEQECWKTLRKSC